MKQLTKGQTFNVYRTGSIHDTNLKTNKRIFSIFSTEVVLSVLP